MTNTSYDRRNKVMVLKRAIDYYENDQEKLREKGRDKHRDLSEEEKLKRENM